MGSLKKKQFFYPCSPYVRGSLRMPVDLAHGSLSLTCWVPRTPTPRSFGRIATLELRFTNRVSISAGTGIINLESFWESQHAVCPSTDPEPRVFTVTLLARASRAVLMLTAVLDDHWLYTIHNPTACLCMVVSILAPTNRQGQNRFSIKRTLID